MDCKALHSAAGIEFKDQYATLGPAEWHLMNINMDELVKKIRHY
jgi:hypothetical protein